MKKRKNYKKIIKRFLKFTTSSSSSAIFDLFLIALLTEFFSIHYLTSTAIAFITANSANYVVNRYWGFKDAQNGFKKGLAMFLTFNLISIIIILFLMWVLVENFHFNYLFARVILALIQGLIGFYFHSKITFKIPKH